MHFKTIFSLVLSVISATVAATTTPKYVFAHFIAGNAASMSSSDWSSDISMAKAAGIDGFAMNIAAGDPNTNNVLATAFYAAQIAGFKLFLSFDYLSEGAWSASSVTSLINQYKSNHAYFLYQGKPLVSTFEGVNNIGDWSGIKASTGCFFIPDWTSLGPSGFASYLNTVDGAFSWDAWPVGASDKTDDTDKAWISAIAGKTYMMPISPWFYTNLPQWDKNWLWRGDDLWHDRWQQAIQLQPPLVEIITWNDYGESHYIGPIHTSGIPSGSFYVPNMPHQAILTQLPYYINAYKSNNATTLNSSIKESIYYYYKLNPGTSGSADGTTGNDPAYQQVVAPTLVSQDKVFLTVNVASAADVTVQIGNSNTTKFRAVTSGLAHFSVPFNGQTGAVKIVISRSGKQYVATTGPAITTNCVNGNVNWNFYGGTS